MNIENIKKRIHESLLDITPMGVSVEVEEESEEMKLVRQIHEEQIEEINVKIRMTLSQPLDYVAVTLSGHTDEKFGIKFEHDTGSRDSSSSDS